MNRVNRFLLRRKSVGAKIRHCNICEWSGGRFIMTFNEHIQRKQEEVCPVCGSFSRQRVLCKYLTERFSNKQNLICLEVAPSNCKPVQKALPKARYSSIDIDTTQNTAMYQADLTCLGGRFNSLDLIVCSHVLEHIEDDTAAIKEMYRVLKVGGEVIIQIPFGFADTGVRTVEHDVPIAYGHLRTYGWDICSRLCGEGFLLTLLQYMDNCICVDKVETLFVCTKQ